MSPAIQDPPSLDAVLRAVHGSLYTDTAGALRTLDTAVAALRADANAPHLARALELQSIGNRILGNYEAALAQNAESSALFHALNDRAGVAKAELLAGNLHWCLGAFEKALALYEAALAVRRELGDRRGEAGALGSIGVVFDDLGRYADARRCYEESLALSEQLDDRAFAARTHNNLGETCLNLGELAAARAHCERALALFRTLTDHAEEANALSNLGKIQRAQGDFTGAAGCFRAALGVSTVSGDPRAQAEAQLFLGALHTEPGAAFYSPIAAIALLRSALAQAEALHACAVEFAVHRELARAHELAGDPVSALAHHRKFHDIHTAVFDEKSARRLRQLQISYELDHARHAAGQERQKSAELARLNRDLTAKKEQLDHAVRDLLRLNQEKNDLLGIAAHDLKNPLASIIGLAELWLTGAGHADDIRQIRTTATELFTLVEHLLETSEYDQAVLPLAAEPLDFAPLLAAVRDDYLPRAKAKGIDLSFDGCAGPLPVRADAVAARRILDNLVSNAVKYSPPATHVRLSGLRAGPDILLSVQDEGPGFFPEDKERLFERFARLSARPTGGEHSSGLGLFITRRLVLAMRGTIVCESEPDRGATFRVRLPAA